MLKPMSRPANVILASLAWAAALIASAIVFKGNPVGDWVEWFLIIGALSFCFWPSGRLSCRPR
jgi:hypothetical protein